MKKTFFIVLLIAVWCLFGCTKVVSEGEKVGTVIKVAKQGVVCNTWEGELIRGGMSNGSGGFSTTPLHFTINDNGLLQKTKEALDGQYEVKVRYVEYFGPMSCASDSSAYFLTSIERLK